MEDCRIKDFISSFNMDLPEYLERVREKAEAEMVPIIRRDMQQLLIFLMQQQSPGKILEIGTAVGFSTMVMGEYAGKAHITTLESYPPRIEAAKMNFKTYGFQERIELMEGDALEILPSLRETYDFVFLDAAKGQYINMLPHILEHMGEKGILLTDNIFQDGDICESKYAVRRRDRTIHGRMREYLLALRNNPKLTTVILPVGDGCTITVVNDKGSGCLL